MLSLIKPTNWIVPTDGYKAVHQEELDELPDGTKIEYVLDAIVPRRSSIYSNTITVFGNTMIANTISKIVIEQWMIEEADVELAQQGYAFNRHGWQIIVDEFSGKLPLAIYGVEDGRVVDPQTPILATINTDPRFGWLGGWYEPLLQSISWPMCSTASLTGSIRKVLGSYIDKTGGDVSQLEYMCHFFGDRGAKGPTEAVVIAAMAHAIYFSGSDCIRVNSYIKALFDTSTAYTSSIEATEHFTSMVYCDVQKKDDFGAAVMAVTRLEKSVERAKNGIGIPAISAVIDTYDSRRYTLEHLSKLKDRIINSSGKFIERPDSGDNTVEPGQVALDQEQVFGIAGYSSTGYKVIQPYLGVLQGDGMCWDTLVPVMDGWVNTGFSTTNFAVGMGYGLVDYVKRDDFSFSFKPTACKKQNTEWIPLLKDPNTDSSKRSLTGLVRCFVENGKIVTRTVESIEEFKDVGNGWRLWVENGERIFAQTFDSVRNFARG